MKKRIALFLSVLMLLAAIPSPAFAAVPGEVIGAVLYTDVVAYIDGFPIRSYNINWYTYIVAEDLLQYGFSVRWIPENKQLVIDPTHTGTPDTYSAAYVPEKNTHVAGEYAMPYLYTEITTWIGERQITGYNIGGYTCIGMDDLAEAFAESYVWDPATITLKLTTKTPAPAATSDSALLPQADGRVPAAEKHVALLTDSVIEELAGMNRTNVDAALTSAFGAEYVDTAIDLWHSYAADFHYEITGSRLRAGGVAEVDVTLTNWDFPAAGEMFSQALFWRTVQGGGIPNADEVSRLLLDALRNSAQFTQTREMKVYVVQTGDRLALADVQENYDYLDALLGDYYLMLENLMPKS